MGDKIELEVDSTLCVVLIQHGTACRLGCKQSESRALAHRRVCPVTRFGRFLLLEVRIKDCAVACLGEGSVAARYRGAGL